jgi:5'-3' exoribonuclease 1
LKNSISIFLKILGVLPPTSRDLLPKPLQSLMIDLDSPLLHFYPEHFQLDQNEKKQDWEAIVLLPFIDEELLLNSITKFYNQLDSNEQLRNQHLSSFCFRTTSKLQPIGNSLGTNPYFPTLKETRATYRECPVGCYELDNLQIKYGRLEEKDLINFPKFPILNVLPYKYAYKNSAVNLFETRSKYTTLILSLTNRPDPDCITYNNQWNPKDDNSSPPFQITNIHLFIERYLGKRVFVNWPHFQYGIVCAISDFRHVYTWSNIPGGSYFYSEPINTEQNQDFRNYIQKPINVSYRPFEISNDQNKKAIYQTFSLNELETQMEYTKAININRIYEHRQGVSIGPIPILLYVSPLIGYRTKCFSTSDKCRTTMCFSNQALAYPLQTTLFKLPNYKDDSEQIPQTIKDYFKVNDPIFALQSPYYSSLGYVQQINQDKHGKYSISCQMESSDVVNQPDIHHLVPKLSEHQLQYFTAQQIADQLKTVSCVISKITGKINVLGENKRRRRANPTNIGLSWKANKPVKQV